MYLKINHTKRAIAFTLSFVFMFLLFACKKDISVVKTTDPKQSNTKMPIETAYPGIEGELVGAKLGEDSVYFRKIGDKYIWMGDIVLDEAHKDSLINSYKTDANARTFHNAASRLWPGGIVYYIIDQNFTATDKQKIENAIAYWNAYTPLQILPRNNQQTNYIYFALGADHSGFYSELIGMKGGQQIINLETGFITGNAMHEIGHAIGFYHEQCRTDRGNAILVNLNNLEPNNPLTQYQYKTYIESGEGGFQIGDFDFESIMLYDSYDNSDQIHPVMTRLDGSTFSKQRFYLSAGDISTAQYMYNPKYYTTFTNTITWLSDPNDWYNDRRTQDYYVHFWSDAAHTQPLALTDKLQIHITLFQTVFQQRIPQYSTSKVSIILQPGNSTYYVTTTDWDLTYDQNMNPNNGAYSIDAGLSAGVGYR